MRVLIGALVSLVPMVFLVLAFVYGAGVDARRYAGRDVRDRVRAIAEAVDVEIFSQIRQLDILATAGELDRDDLAGFHRRMVEVSRVGQGEWPKLAILDPTGQLLASSAKPFGDAMPKTGMPDQVAAVVRTGRPQAYGVLPRGVLSTSSPVVVVGLPIIRDGAVKYVLHAAFPPSSLGDILARQNLAGEARAMVVDPAMRLAARSDEADPAVGQSVPPSVLAQLSNLADEFDFTTTVDGAPTQFFVKRLASTGWMLALGMPAEAADAPARRIRLAGVGALTITILASLLVAWLIASGDRRLRRTEAAHLAEITAAKDNAELANRSKTEFLAAMSHELRTPLGAVIGFSEAMLMEIFGTVGDSRYVEYLNHIHTSGTHLLELVNDILDVSVIELGKVTLHREEVLVTEMVRRSWHLVRPRAERKGLRFDTDLTAAPIRIVVDVRRVMQILVNLLGNAVKFTPEGGSVTLRVTREGGISLIVADTGIGMDADGLAKALTMFGQVDGSYSRKYEGSGLGLPISQHLAESLGGRLAMESRPGEGTTVTVTLPPDCVVE